jgi:hypothetical protein
VRSHRLFAEHRKCFKVRTTACSDAFRASTSASSMRLSVVRLASRWPSCNSGTVISPDIARNAGALAIHPFVICASPRIAIASRDISSPSRTRSGGATMKAEWEKVYRSAPMERNSVLKQLRVEKAHKAVARRIRKTTDNSERRKAGSCNGNAEPFA